MMDFFQYECGIVQNTFALWLKDRFYTCQIWEINPDDVIVMSPRLLWLEHVFIRKPALQIALMKFVRHIYQV